MNTRLPRQELHDALTAISSLVSARTTKPILACVQLTVQDDSVELCATDGEAGLRLSIPALAVEERGAAVVGVDRLVGIVRELPDAELTLQTDESHCLIRGHASEFKLFVQNAADFPPVPTFEGPPDIVIDGRELRRMIALTLYAAARETSRYAINGVLWDKAGKRLNLVATDGRRLARAGGSLASAQGADFEVIVPTKALSVLERVCIPAGDDKDGAVEVSISPNQAVLKSGKYTLSTTLLEGRFPKYGDVIPQEITKCATLNREEFNRAIRQAALLTTEDSRAVQLSFSAERLILTSRSPEQGEARLEMPIEYKGDALEIAFNPAFLGDVLRALPYDAVQLEMHESSRPGIISGDDKADFLYVLMPVSLAP